MSARYEPLKTIVAFFLDANKLSYAEMDTAWLIGFRGLEAMHFSVTAEPKTVRLDVNGNLTVTLPADYISWSKIGVLDSGGQIVPIKINHSLSKFKSLHPERVQDSDADVTDIMSGYFYNYLYGGAYSHFPINAAITNTYGECVVDEKNNVIVLDPNFRFSHVMVEYINAPEMDSDYMVDRRLREPLIAFMEWKFKLGTEQSFYARFTEGRRMIDPVTPQKYRSAATQYSATKVTWG